MRPRTLSSAALRCHVGHVVGLRPKKQVVRSDARRVVAAMANLQAIRDCAVMQLPGDTVRKLSDSAPLYANAAVAECGEIARPRPASFRPSDVAPKAFRERRECRLQRSQRLPSVLLQIVRVAKSEAIDLAVAVRTTARHESNSTRAI